MNSDKRKNKIYFTIIILIQCLFITYIFSVKKEGYHSDELWNYGFANSTDGMHIFSYDGKDYKNCFMWTDSKVLLDYISVDKSEIFSYYDIYKNAALDINPPFQYMVLHFVCSFFPNIWSKWFCFFINIICFAITQLFIFKILKLINKDDNVAYWGILMYGFCMGAVDISIFLRIYALGVCFVMAFLYYSTYIFLNKDNTKKSNFVKLFLTELFGALTIHQFLIIAFIVTLLYSVYYMLNKKYKIMLKYGLTGSLSVSLSILIFPSTISHMFSVGSRYSKTIIRFIYQFEIYLSYILMDTIGIHNTLKPSETYASVSLIVGLVIVCIVIFCIFSRKRSWFIKAKGRCVDYINRMLVNLKNKGYSFVVVILCIVFMISMCAQNSSSWDMGGYARRYVFLVYPVFVVAFVTLLSSFTDATSKNKKYLGYIISLGLALLSFGLADKCYYFSFKDNDEALNEIEKDADCIIVLDELWVSTAATNELYDTGNFYLTMRKYYEQNNYNEKKDYSVPLYLVLDVSNEYYSDNPDDMEAAQALGRFTNKSEILEYYQKLDISSECRYIGSDYLYNRKVEIYKLND